MDKYFYIPLNVGDLMNDSKVIVMDATAFGAYMALLCRAWVESPPASLPTDDATLAIYAKCSLDQWEAVKAKVLACFKLKKNRYVQKRLLKEFKRLKKVSAIKAANARGKVKADAEQPLDNSKANGEHPNYNYKSLPDGGKEVEKPSGEFPPTLAEFRKYAGAVGLPDAEIESCFNHHAATGFMRRGTPLTNYASLLASWKARGAEFKTGANGTPGPRQRWQIEKDREAARAELLRLQDKLKFVYRLTVEDDGHWLEQMRNRAHAGDTDAQRDATAIETVRAKINSLTAEFTKP